MSIRKRLRYAYYRAVRNHGEPSEVAAGGAVGMAVGLTPIVGHTPLAVAIAALTGQSKLAAALGVWVNNPVTFPFIYGGSYVIGAWMLGYPLTPPGGFLGACAHLGSFTSKLFLPLLLGSLILAIPVSLAGYWVTYKAVLAYRRNARRRRSERTHRWLWHPERGWHRSLAPEEPS